MRQVKLDDDTYEVELKYMEQWRNEEQWDDFNIILDRAYIDINQLRFACSFLLETGAIDSKHCYAQFQTVECSIEKLAAQFRSLPKVERDGIAERTFHGVKTFSCTDERCNHVSFVSDGNETLYAEELEKCWSCGGPVVKGEM